MKRSYRIRTWMPAGLFKALVPVGFLRASGPALYKRDPEVSAVIGQQAYLPEVRIIFKLTRAVDQKQHNDRL